VIRALALLTGAIAVSACVSMPECAPAQFGELAIGSRVGAQPLCGGKADCDFTASDRVTYVILDNVVREKRVLAADLASELRDVATLDGADRDRIERALCVGKLELVEDAGDRYLQSAERPNPVTRYPERTIIDIRDGGGLTVSVTSLPAV
jgi:hypothetical protein